MTPTRRAAITGGVATMVGAHASPGIDGATGACLAPTRYINSDHSAVRAAAARSLAEAGVGAGGRAAKARAIFHWVRDEIKFGFGRGFWDAKASDVLAMGRGYCNTKSTLFVALLRAADIPARQVFVDIHASVLSGILDPGTPYVDHSYVDVWLDGAWRATDAYIVDAPLFDAARPLAAAEGRVMGYGVHAAGTRDWDGRTPSFSQFNMAGPRPIHTRIWGVYEDVGAFYASTPDTWNRLNPMLRAGMGALAKGANARADALRKR